jgi:hypothetical protein
MRFNFKKIVSVLASAAMLGSTVGMAAAAAYPAPFIQGGTANVAVVVGASAATIDNIAAVDVGANLQENLAKQTATTTTSGASATGGDSVNLATSSQKLYFNSSLNAARSSISKTELPTLLADGKITDDAGTEYSYKQSLTPGNSTITFGTSGSDLTDPALVVQVGTEANSYLYQLDVTFNKNINITSTDVQGNSMNILGKDYTIGAGSSSNTPVLYLYGSGTEKSIKEGETSTVEVSGKTYTLELKSVEQISSVNYISVSVDGGTVRRIQEGVSSKVGDLEIYAKSVHFLSKEAQVSYADLNIGTSKIKIGSSGTTVKMGTDETSVQGTRSYITSSNGVVSGFTVKVAMQKAATDHLAVGKTYDDPVFGALQVQFADVVPALDDANRDKVVIDTDNSRNAKVTFTSALAGDSGEKTIYFAHDQDTAESTITTILADSGNKTITVVEGVNIVDQNFAVINAGDYGRIVRVTVPTETNLETTSYVQLEDVITGKNLFDGGLTVGTDGMASTNIDGNTYYFNVGNGSTTNTVNITWGAGSNEGCVGDKTTIFPRIKTAKGGWIAFLKTTAITQGSSYSLPGIQTLADYESGLTISNNTVGTAGSKKFGNANYSITFNGAVGNITGIDMDGDGTLVSGTDCLFNSTSENGMALLFMEEKKATETNNADNGDIICVNVDKNGATTPIEVSVSTPVISGVNSGLQSLTSDSNLRQIVTRYGTFVEYDSTDNDKVTIKYPDEQMYADVLLTAIGAEVTPGSQGGSVASLGSVAVMDSEVSTVSSKNLIVIGGSCINTVAAKILGSDSPICYLDFTAKTNVSAGQFLIKVVDSPYATGKVAMLVAGYEGADTRKAATYLVSMKPSTVVGTELKKQTATYADVV